MQCRGESFHFPKQIFDLLPILLIPDVFILAPLPHTLGTPQWFQFVSIAPTCPQLDVGTSHRGGIHIVFAVEVQHTVFLGLFLQCLQTKHFARCRPLAFGEAEESDFWSFSFEISNCNVASFVGRVYSGQLRVHHEVFVSGEDVAVENNLHKSRCFVLSGISYSAVDVRNVSSEI